MDDSAHGVPGAMLRRLEQLCTEFAVTAGKFIRDERPERVQVESTKSSDTDVVTVMDQRSEAMLRRLIREHRPDDGILGEEGADVAGTSGLTWVIDPIDGTVNYLYDIPAYAVSVAVVLGDARVDGEWSPLAGAVADPCRRLVHHARRGGGAWTSEEDAAAAVGPDERDDPVTAGAEPIRLRVSAEDRLHRVLLATGFGYAVDVRARQAETLRRVLPAVRDIRRIGSAALDLVRVADGSVDAYAESGINAWDLAAGWLLVEEAGGVVRGLPGSADGRPGKALTVASGPQLLEPVRSLFLG